MDIDMDVGTTTGQTGRVSFSTTSADSQRLLQASDEESLFSGYEEVTITFMNVSLPFGIDFLFFFSDSREPSQSCSFSGG